MPKKIPFEDQIDKSGECWIWTGLRNRDGYGKTNENGQFWIASRLAWAKTYGPIPIGMCVCHKCDNPPCVRPDHLFLGTDLDNKRDCLAKGRHACRRNVALAHKKQASKTHCPRGHEYTPENTRLHFHRNTGRTSRDCRACEKVRRDMSRKPEAAIYVAGKDDE